MSSLPKLTNPLRPVARYRKGQQPANAPSDSDSDEEAVEQPSEGEEELKPTVVKKEVMAKMAVALREVEVDKGGVVRVGGKGEVGRTERELESSEDEGTESEEDEPVKKTYVVAGVDADEGSSEYETDSEDEAPAPIYKPVFVSKRNRDTITEREKELDPEAMEEKRLAEAEIRQKQSNDLVADSIIRELAEKEVEEVFPDVDDTDGTEPQLEFEAWKLRELMRIKCDREAQYAHEKVREEVEARRAMPEELRMKEDMDRAKKLRDEKPKGQQVFLQKYHHKGAFYTDLEVLKKHDYTAPSQSTNRNIESLPAAMQVRNFGKMSQSKYTHLAKEDTTNANTAWGKKPPGTTGGTSGGCFTCGGAHLKRDCPQAGGGPAGPSGSNGGGPGGSRDSGYQPRPSTSQPRPPSDRPRSPPRRDDGRPRSPPRNNGPADWETRTRERTYAREEERERNRGAGGYRDEYRQDEYRSRDEGRDDRGYSREGDRYGRGNGRERERSRSRSPGREGRRSTSPRDEKRRRRD